jgi:hypothetical protein
MAQAEYHGKVVALQVEEGQTDSATGRKKDPIASYSPARREHYLVFLPTDAPVGKTVRIRLVDIGKTDRRGSSLYRGIPEVEYTNRWKDNGDGTATLVTIESDWLFEESEVGEVETRALLTEENLSMAETESNFSVNWGVDLDSTKVIDIQKTTIPIQTEVVSVDGVKSWSTVSHRVEISAPEIFTVTDFGFRTIPWDQAVVTIPPGSKFWVYLSFQNDNPGKKTQLFELEWDTAPIWIKSIWEQGHPVCSCGRSRLKPIADALFDGYGKCELCRVEENCVRCGKKGKIENLAGRLVCNFCNPYESAEQLVRRHVAEAHKLAVASEASKLLLGKAVERDLAEAIFKASLDHITEERTKDRLLQNWLYKETNSCKRQYWYFCEDGVYGSLYSPAALLLLSYLPQAQGNGLVDLAYWLATEGVYYMNVHVENRQAGLPSVDESTFSKLVEKLSQGQPVLATWLRGRDSDREAATKLFATLKVRFGDKPEIEEAEKLLQADEQRYDKALQALQNAEWRLTERAEAVARGDVWPDVGVFISTESRTDTSSWVILPDGSVMEPLEEKSGGGRKSRVHAHFYGDLPNTYLVLKHEHDNYGYRLNERWEVCYLPKVLTQEQRSAVREIETESRRYFDGSETGWQLSQVGSHCVQTLYTRDLDEEDRTAYELMTASFPILVSDWDIEKQEDGTIEVWPKVRRSSEQKRIGTLQEQLATLHVASNKAVATEKSVRGRLAKTEEFVLEVFRKAQQEKLYVKPDRENSASTDAYQNKRRDVARSGKVFLLNLQWDEEKGEWFSEVTVGSAKLDTERTAKLFVQPHPDFWPEQSGEYFCEGNLLLFLSRDVIGILVNVLGPKDPKAYYQSEMSALKVQVVEAERTLSASEKTEVVSGENLRTAAELLMQKWGRK